MHPYVAMSHLSSHNITQVYVGFRFNETCRLKHSIIFHAVTIGDVRAADHIYYH